MIGRLAHSSEETARRTANDVLAQRIEMSCWAICILLAMLEVWTGRNYTDPDGISYIDMSDGLLVHHWQLLANAYWSPLYPFLIGAMRWVIRPSGFWEIPAVHCVNFLILIATLASFSYFFNRFIRVAYRDDRLSGDESMLPEWALTLAGYGVFAWSSFVLIDGVRKVVPDLCVAACIYLDTGLLLRLRASANKLPTFLLLGFTLGLGYYAKAVLFPIAFLFIAAASFVAGNWQKLLLPWLTMVAVFIAISLPLVVATSEAAGHVTFGDTGSNNYARMISGEPTLPFYSSTSPIYLTHPLSLLYHSPNVYAFGKPFNATYPLWYDISYWDAGFKSTFSVHAQLRAVTQNLKTVFTQVILPVSGSIVAYLLLLAMGRNLTASFWNTMRNWPLIAPGLAGVCLYLLVCVEARYIGPFVVLIWLGLLSAIRIRRTPGSMKAANITAVIFAGWLIALSAGLSVYHLLRPLPVLLGDGGTYYPVAKFLNASGLEPGQNVGIIGSGWDAMMWARRARLRIVAQIPPQSTSEFWQIRDQSKKAQVYDAFRKAGAIAVVTEETPPSGDFEDWQQIGNTSYSVHYLFPEGSR